MRSLGNRTPTVLEDVEGRLLQPVELLVVEEPHAAGRADRLQRRRRAEGRGRGLDRRPVIGRLPRVRARWPRRRARRDVTRVATGPRSRCSTTTIVEIALISGVTPNRIRE